MILPFLIASWQLSVLGVTDWGQPFTGPLGDCQVGKPTVLRRPVPVLDAGFDYHHVAGVEQLGGVAGCLVPARPSRDQQDLVAIVVDVPVVAATRFKADVADGKVD